MTTGPSYERVFDRLRQTFADWNELADTTVETLAEAIGGAGLANQKAPRFIDIARRLRQEFGSATLDPLTSYTDQRAEEFLTSLPGVGSKTAKCVMMYSMGRSVLPVDTHVARISRRLGLLGEETPKTRWHVELEAVVAPRHRYDYHVNCVAHGREVCRANAPRCEWCALRSLCPSGRTVRRGPKQAISGDVGVDRQVIGKNFTRHDPRDF